MGPRKPGRPPRSGGAADRRISVRVTEEEFAAWTRAAGDKTIGDWIRGLAAAAVRKKLAAERREPKNR